MTGQSTTTVKQRPVWIIALLVGVAVWNKSVIITDKVLNSVLTFYIPEIF